MARCEAALAGLMTVLLAAACDSGTGGRPVSFTLSMGTGTASPGDQPAVFRTGTGWGVTLEEACVAVGPVYLWLGAGHLTGRWPRLIRRAEAHVGDQHFYGGEVRGEWVGQIVLDALAPHPVELTGLSGLEGSVRSFSLQLDPPAPTLTNAACLHGHHAYVVGVASRDEHEVPFEGGLVIENIGTSRRVEGLALSGHLADRGRVNITVFPRAWFDGARFETLTSRNPAGRFVITRDSQVHAAWFVGARGAHAFAGAIAP